ncbi:MAG: hypothetical protein K2L12_06420 [Clostridia bacterium]|nr:hypothetical protein [Clostridia bacterium]
MKKYSSAYYAAMLAEGLSEAELPLDGRTDKWWDEFWHYIGIAEAQSIKELQ